MASDIVIPKHWQQYSEQLKQKRTEEEGQQFHGLSKQLSDKYLTEAKNREIKDPRLFKKNIDALLKDIGDVHSGSAERLKHKLIDLSNSVRGNQPLTLPKETQEELLKDVSEFDKRGVFVRELNNAFEEKPGEMLELEKAYRARTTGKYCEAAAKLRKIASILLKLASNKK